MGVCFFSYTCIHIRVQTYTSLYQPIPIFWQCLHHHFLISRRSCKEMMSIQCGATAGDNLLSRTEFVDGIISRTSSSWAFTTTTAEPPTIHKYALTTSYSRSTPAKPHPTIRRWLSQSRKQRWWAFIWRQCSTVRLSSSLFSLCIVDCGHCRSLCCTITLTFHHPLGSTIEDMELPVPVSYLHSAFPRYHHRTSYSLIHLPSGS